jgi:hypothetical protein
MALTAATRMARMADGADGGWLMAPTAGGGAAAWRRR